MKNLKLEIEKRGISINRLGLETKINPSNLCQAMKGHIPFYPAWRKRISHYFKMKESYLFDHEEGDVEIVKIEMWVHFGILNLILKFLNETIKS